MTRLRFFDTIDPVDTKMLEEAAALAPGHPSITQLEPYPTDRPAVNPHPIPHRLLSTSAAPTVQRQLDEMFVAVARENDDRVTLARSHYERHTDAAVTARRIAYNHTQALLAHGEIGHVHPTDGSIHLNLHPLDAATAIRAGWGELHPLSGQGQLPAGYLFVYPPTEEKGVQVIAEMLRAAIEYVTAVPE